MSEATEYAAEDQLGTPYPTHDHPPDQMHDNSSDPTAEFSAIPPTDPPPGPRHRARARLVRTRLAVLATALLMLVGGGTWWAMASAGQRSTHGHAIPRPGAITEIATATPDATAATSASATPAPPSAGTPAPATPNQGPAVAAPAKSPPPPPPPPMPGSWPTAASTGASGALAPASGDVTLSTDGQVYSNVHLRGTLTVTACNVTIRNVEVDSGVPYTGDSTPDLFSIWLQEPVNCGVTIDRVTTLAEPAPNVYVTTSIRDARGAPVTITNSRLIGAQLGILGISGGLIRDNYIELGQNMRGDHNDSVQADGSSGLTLDHNTLLNPNDQTSALALYTEYGNNTNDMIKNNLLAGGGFACYCGDGKADNNGNPARAVNVSFVNNVFWRRYFPDAGYFGAGRAYNPAGGGQWTNNVYMAPDGTLTGEQVPQPPVDQ